MSVLSEFKGNVNLSSDAGTSTTVGTTLKVNTVEAKVATDAIALYNNATSGGITIGSAQTGNMLLGSTSSITQVQGTLVANALNAKTVTANMTIASTATNATLTVGGNMTSSGGITLGSAACSTTVNGTLISNKIASTAVLKINETNNVETAINSATTVAQNLTLGTPTYTTQYLRGGTININEFGSGNTVIGTSGGTGAITLNRPITIGYSPTFTSSQIGYTGTSTFTGTLVNGVNNVSPRISSTTLAGVYTISTRFVINGGTFTNVSLVRMETGYYGGATLGQYYIEGTLVTFIDLRQTISTTYNSTAGLEFYNAIQVTWSAPNPTAPIFTSYNIYTRIA